MNYKNILITGGAGFVGSNLAIKLKETYEDVNIYAFDNLKRRGSELNIPRLKEHGVEFVHGDVRNKEDFVFGGSVDLVVDCSAEPSVLAGLGGSPEYVIQTNLAGTLNCLEFARTNGADFVFLSTSRVYSIEHLNSLAYSETDTRFELSEKQTIEGVTVKGIAENFPIGGVRSMYGTTKLCSEQVLLEYLDAYDMRGVINRCGVITGPWQMGKVDQGVIVLWIARHVWANKPLSYIGYGGKGKQVRDFMHIDDLFEAMKIQLEDMRKYNKGTFNLGGGTDVSLSLREMTDLCEKITGNSIEIASVPETRQNDIPIYVSDYSKFAGVSGWKPATSAEKTFEDVYSWIVSNKATLASVLG